MIRSDLNCVFLMTHYLPSKLNLISKRCILPLNVARRLDNIYTLLPQSYCYTFVCIISVILCTIRFRIFCVLYRMFQKELYNFESL